MPGPCSRSTSEWSHVLLKVTGESSTLPFGSDKDTYRNQRRSYRTAEPTPRMNLSHAQPSVRRIGPADYQQTFATINEALQRTIDQRTSLVEKLRAVDAELRRLVEPIPESVYDDRPLVDVSWLSEDACMAAGIFAGVRLRVTDQCINLVVSRDGRFLVNAHGEGADNAESVKIEGVPINAIDMTGVGDHYDTTLIARSEDSFFRLPTANMLEQFLQPIHARWFVHAAKVRYVNTGVR